MTLLKYLTKTSVNGEKNWLHLILKCSWKDIHPKQKYIKTQEMTKHWLFLIFHHHYLEYKSPRTCQQTCTVFRFSVPDCMEIWGGKRIKALFKGLKHYEINIKLTYALTGSKPCPPIIKWWLTKGIPGGKLGGTLSGEIKTSVDLSLDKVKQKVVCFKVCKTVTNFRLWYD